MGAKRVVALKESSFRSKVGIRKWVKEVAYSYVYTL